MVNLDFFFSAVFILWLFQMMESLKCCCWSCWISVSLWLLEHIVLCWRPCPQLCLSQSTVLHSPVDNCVSLSGVDCLATLCSVRLLWCCLKKNKKAWRAIVFQALGKVWWREKIVHTVCVNDHVFINFRATIWQWYKNGRWICWTELLSSFYLSLIVARNLTQLYVRLFIYVNYLLCIQPDFWN